MVTIPLYIFLFIYFFFLSIFTAFSIVNFYHIIMSGSFTFASFIVTFFTFTLTVLTLYATWYLLAEINWQAVITLLNSDWLTNTPIF